jgi:hypothetical protein
MWQKALMWQKWCGLIFSVCLKKIDVGENGCETWLYTVALEVKFDP